MIFLIGSNDRVLLITGQAVPVHVHGTFADYDGVSDAVAGRANTIVSTATTTTIVPAPAGGVSRNVKTLRLRNNHATDPVDVTIQWDKNGTIVEEEKRQLQAGQSLAYDEGDGWRTFASTGTIR